MDSGLQSDEELLAANEALTEMSVCNINDSIVYTVKNLITLRISNICDNILASLVFFPSLFQPVYYMQTHRFIHHSKYLMLQ